MRDGDVREFGPLNERNVDGSAHNAPWLRFILGVLVAVLGSLVLFDLWVHPDLYQGDLRAYYSAGRAYAAGLDPYATHVLSDLAGTPVTHGFVYPPITLPAFRLLSEIPYPALYRLVLVAKAVLLGMLFYLWSRRFLSRFSLTFILFALVAYNASIYVDFRVGNISILEQAAIWLGLYFFLQRKLVPFAILVLGVSLLKVTPILLLALLLLSKDKRRYLYFGLSVGSFLVLMLVSLAVSPRLFGGFLTATSGLSDRGVVNPSTLQFVQASLDILGRSLPAEIPILIVYLVYLVLAGGITYAAFNAMRNLSNLPSIQRRLWSIYIVCLSYGLIVPRFKTYSYMIVLLPTYFIVAEAGRSLRARHPKTLLIESLPLLAVVVLSSIYVPVYGATAFESSLLGYAPWAALVASWILFMSGIGLRGPGWLFTRVRSVTEVSGTFEVGIKPQEAGGSLVSKAAEDDAPAWHDGTQGRDLVREIGMTKVT